ncbi:hypothetical protein GCM10017600_64170 [Streptosporangium carneum]|uniref:Uncharacterized protein n=1 Tax=Streptosporangium carneum TaxID=47481 RepID=A0A9W6I6G8_9ACTN|nr:hypothetical protein GCM10017600_64170 [Streptosporangium carneum]
MVVTKRSFGWAKGSFAFLNWVFHARFRQRLTRVMKYRYEAALPARICPAPQRIVGRVPVRYSGLAVAAVRPRGTCRVAVAAPEATVGDWAAEDCAVEEASAASAEAEALVAGRGASAFAVPTPMTRENARDAMVSDDSCLKGRVLMVRQRLLQVWIKRAESSSLEEPSATRTRLGADADRQRG